MNHRSRRLECLSWSASYPAVNRGHSSPPSPHPTLQQCWTDKYHEPQRPKARMFCVLPSWDQTRATHRHPTRLSNKAEQINRMNHSGRRLECFVSCPALQQCWTDKYCEPQRPKARILVLTAVLPSCDQTTAPHSHPTRLSHNDEQITSMYQRGRRLECWSWPASCSAVIRPWLPTVTPPDSPTMLNR